MAACKSGGTAQATSVCPLMAARQIVFAEGSPNKLSRPTWYLGAVPVSHREAGLRPPPQNLGQLGAGVSARVLLWLGLAASEWTRCAAAGSCEGRRPGETLEGAGVLTCPGPWGPAAAQPAHLSLCVLFLTTPGSAQERLPVRCLEVPLVSVFRGSGSAGDQTQVLHRPRLFLVI